MRLQMSTAIAVVALTVSTAQGATVTLRPGDPLVGGPAAITDAQGRSGRGAIDLSTGAYFVLEHPLGSGGSFGTWGDLSALRFDGYVTGSNLARPEIALRLNYYGEATSFFVAANLRIQEPDTWVTHDVFGDWRIQRAEGDEPPSEFGEIPLDTPITGIHVRDVAWMGAPYVGYADNIVIRFGEQETRFNLEPRQAAVTAPAPLTMVGLGMLGVLHRWVNTRRRRS